MTIRELPHSKQAEEALLGALLVYPQAMTVSIEMSLLPKDFFVVSHQKIFQAMLDCSYQNQIIDLNTVGTQLNANQQLEAVGGIDYLLALTRNAVAFVNTRHYAQMILDKAQLRALIEQSQLIIEKAQSGEGLDDILDFSEAGLLNVTRHRQTSDFREGAQVVNEVIKSITHLSENKSSVTGLPTAYRALDSITYGLQKGDLILLAARPSMGKTAFALNIAMNSAIVSKKAIALFSLEMPAEHLIQRMLSAKSMVKSDHLRTGKMTNNDWNALHEAANDLRQTKIFIDDSATIRMSEIFSKCRKLAADHPLGLIVIDYIQLISSTGSNENRQQEVSLISRQLKGLARELDVPVIALSQLSRRVEQRDNKRPILSDLRESGSLEQDADIVMFLYRSEYYNQNKDGEEQTTPNIVEPVEVLIAKHRNGATGTVNLQFQSNINKFFESAMRNE